MIQEAGLGSPSSNPLFVTRFVVSSPPTGMRSTVKPSKSRMPVAPISPSDMIASFVPGGTGMRLATRVHRSRTV